MISSMLPAEQVSWKWKFAQKVGTVGIPPSAKVTMRLEHWSVVSTIYSWDKIISWNRLGQVIKDQEVQKDVLPVLR